MASGRGRLDISGNGDSFSASNKWVTCEFEGWYVIEIDGTIDTSTVVKPWISFSDENSPQWKEIPDPHSATYAVFTFTATGSRTVVVPGNAIVKFVTTDYDSSANLVARRTRVAK